MARRFEIGTGHRETYELAPHTKTGSDDATRADSLVDTLVQRPKELPPMTLSRQKTKRAVAFVTLLVIALIVGFVFIVPFQGRFAPGNFDISFSNSNTCDLATLTGNTVQSAFTINLRCSSHLTYAEAKTIDVIRDLFVGQGGRLFLGWISYRVFMDCLLRLMETSAVSYELYASLAFESTCLMSLLNLLKALFRMKGWRSKIFLVWFFFSTLYVLAFSTLISAGSGYVTPSTAGLTMTDGTFLTPFNQLTQCFNLGEYGSLIGLANDTIVPGPVSHIYLDAIDRTEVPKFEKLKASSSELFYAVFMYRIDVELGYNRTDQVPFATNITIQNHTYILSSFDLLVPAYFCYNDQFLPWDLTPIAKCLPEPYFVWGWSSLLLYITLSLQLCWTLGMFGVWIDANLNSQLCRKGRKVRGYFRAAADLSEAMRETLGDEFCAYRDADIARELRQERNGLRYYSTDVKDGEISHIGIRSIRRDELTLRDGVLYGAHTTRREGTAQAGVRPREGSVGYTKDTEQPGLLD